MTTIAGAIVANVREVMALHAGCICLNVLGRFHRDWPSSGLHLRGAIYGGFWPPRFDLPDDRSSHARASVFHDIARAMSPHTALPTRLQRIPVLVRHLEEYGAVRDFGDDDECFTERLD